MKPTTARRYEVFSSESAFGSEAMKPLRFARWRMSCTMLRPDEIARNPHASVATNTWMTSHGDCRAGGSGVIST